MKNSRTGDAFGVPFGSLRDPLWYPRGALFPTVTVVIATKNSERTIDACLQSIRDQEYPQEKIDIILADGGSTDRTLEIVQRYRPEVLHIDSLIQHAEYNKGFAVRKATGDLLLMVDHDNVLPHRQWLQKMIQPLLDHPEVVGVETLRYRYDPRQNILDRYAALFGTSDPLAYSLGKADRVPYASSAYTLLGTAVNHGAYYLVRFDPEHVPAIGANGFVIRRQLLVTHALVGPRHFYHTDVNVDLIRKGFDTYAFIQDDIIHITSYKNLWGFLARRKLFMEQTHIRGSEQHARRYSVYTPRDRFKLMLFIFSALTVVKPTVDALRGYRKIRDRAWFLHPFLSCALVVLFTSAFLKTGIVRMARRSR